MSFRFIDTDPNINLNFGDDILYQYIARNDKEFDNMIYDNIDVTPHKSHKKNLKPQTLKIGISQPPHSNLS